MPMQTVALNAYENDGFECQCNENGGSGRL